MSYLEKSCTATDAKDAKGNKSEGLDHGITRMALASAVFASDVTSPLISFAPFASFAFQSLGLGVRGGA
jgi:hypothetical protein